MVQSKLTIDAIPVIPFCDGDIQPAEIFGDITRYLYISIAIYNPLCLSFGDGDLRGGARKVGDQEGEANSLCAKFIV